MAVIRWRYTRQSCQDLQRRLKNNGLIPITNVEIIERTGLAGPNGNGICAAFQVETHRYGEDGKTTAGIWLIDDNTCPAIHTKERLQIV